MSSINVGEVFYIYHRKMGERKAQDILSAFQSLPIKIEGVTLQHALEAGKIKATTRKLSYVDCFAAALAKMKNKQLITSDTDFLELKDIIKIILV